MPAPLYIALLHHPVVNKQGDVVTTSVTNFDLHDLGRCARTFGLRHFFIVTPNPAQQNMAHYIKRYWCIGPGATFNPTRKDALEPMEVKSNLAETCLTIQNLHGRPPQLVATSAKAAKKAIGFTDLRSIFRESENPFLILFGTGWGMAPEVFLQVDYILKPICGPSDYNHLPVRAAVAIVLDRLLGS